MVKKTEYDFLTWMSFPSSAKITNDDIEDWAVWPKRATVPVKPGVNITVKVKAKQENLLTDSPSHISILQWDGAKWREVTFLVLPKGTYGWGEFSDSIGILSEASTILVTPVCGWASLGKPAITWFDDLKIYQDDVLIYSDDFSNWSPIIGAGVGAPIGGVVGYLLKEPLGPIVSEAVGAVLGGALGGGVGLLTGLGIIPIPQIPPLGAAPEGPVAPARLGKYQITG